MKLDGIRENIIEIQDEEVNKSTRELRIAEESRLRSQAINQLINQYQARLAHAQRQNDVLFTIILLGVAAAAVFLPCLDIGGVR